MSLFWIILDSISAIPIVWHYFKYRFQSAYETLIRDLMTLEEISEIKLLELHVTARKANQIGHPLFFIIMMAYCRMVSKEKIYPQTTDSISHFAVVLDNFTLLCFQHPLIY